MARGGRGLAADIALSLIELHGVVIDGRLAPLAEARRLLAPAALQSLIVKIEVNGVLVAAVNTRLAWRRCLYTCGGDKACARHCLPREEARLAREAARLVLKASQDGVSIDS